MAPMKGKRWGWIVLGLIVAGAAVFYFMSPAKRQQWIGVLYPDSPSTEAQLPTIRVTEPGEPAPPASGNEDVDLVAKEAPSNISGEVTVAIGFGGSTATDQPVGQTETSIDPAVLEEIGRTLWTTLHPIYDPLLATIDSPKADMLCQVLLGSQNSIQEVKLPAPSVRPARKIVAEDRHRLSNEDGRLQDLITETQTIRDASWSDTNVPRGVLQTVNSPTELGVTGSSLRANPITKQPLSSQLPLGH
jgi:hypothetical protein